MAYNGNSMEKDVKTGYLQPANNYAIKGFTAEKKVRFLEEYMESGNLSKAAAIIGFDHNIVARHRKLDQQFDMDYRRAEMVMRGELEETMYRRGKTPGGYMDRITWLRHKYPREYDPKRVEVEANKEREGKLDALIKIVEAKPVEGGGQAASD